jgi:Holliday junction DNA helicase RuvA
MIEILRGVILENDGEHVVLDVHGVGYGVDIPASTAASLPPLHEEATLFVHLHVIENDMRLYGFATREERELFEIFISISGIGPRTALAILSSLRIPDFVNAVRNDDIALLTRIPGIGKKTAERLIVELRDKIKKWEIRSAAGELGKKGEAPTLSGTLLPEVSAALQALGCKPAIADRAAMRAIEILGENSSLEELVREALKHRW